MDASPSPNIAYPSRLHFAVKMCSPSLNRTMPHPYSFELHLLQRHDIQGYVETMRAQCCVDNGNARAPEKRKSGD